MTPAAIFLDSGIQSDTLLPPKVFDERLLHFQRRVSAWGQARPIKHIVRRKFSNCGRNVAQSVLKSA